MSLSKNSSMDIRSRVAWAARRIARSKRSASQRKSSEHRQAVVMPAQVNAVPHAGGTPTATARKGTIIRQAGDVASHLVGPAVRDWASVKLRATSGRNLLTAEVGVDRRRVRANLLSPVQESLDPARAPQSPERNQRSRRVPNQAHLSVVACAIRAAVVRTVVARPK